MEREKALQSLIEISNCNLGFIPSTPIEFSELSNTIFMKTKTRLSVSSIKRLWGYVSYTNFPSRSTLNILARFNDFRDWESYVQEIKFGDETGETNSSFVNNSILNANQLNIGDVITLGWDPEKGCKLEYISYLRFKVLESINIKLQPGDTCTINSICIDMPLFVSNIQRDTTVIPAYIGARQGGIKQIQVANHPDD